eukprot:gnl/Spiro4/14604_TR7865_c0_g1_i1.p1 gnl/Spiro4/14604_TR7865_c0_g1~~gnl/Spiro4/14604_TR7865_c0_g1_i1.p1  ORF type:complete len:441 (-),score=135.66 gnl/Spiro4/14604_TR7865_c0_g1_i1:62-1351(-)
MKCLIAVVCVFLLASAVALAPKPSPFQRRQGHQTFCHDKKEYSVSYNTYGTNDDAFVSLDSISGLETFTCNIDQTQLLLTFSDQASASAFFSSLVKVEMFVVEGSKFACVNSTSPLHRVLDFQTTESLEVTVHAVTARYDEVFQDADMNMTSTGRTGQCGQDKDICIGMNTDDSCQKAAASLPIYSNKYVQIACSDCFLAFNADLFLTMSIRLFHLNQLAGGFRNMAVNGALVFDMQAQNTWSTGVDKQITIAQPTTVVSFNIGPIPIRLWFNINMHVVADSTFNAQAHATVGANAVWSLGDLSVSWDPVNHWQTVTPKPSLSWSPSIAGDASFNSQSTFTAAPTVQLHVDSVFTYQTTITPTLNLDISGSSSPKQICASATGEVGIVAQADLDINIPWVHIVKDKTFGPYTLYDSGVQQLFKKTCVDL